jgi:hypothetical protein
MNLSHLVCCVAPLVLILGCGAPLTKPQVAAVASFRDSTHDYSPLPGSVVRAYEQVRTENAILDLATGKVELAALDPEGQRRVIDGSRNRLKRVVAGRATLDSQADQVDRALCLLDQYSAGLKALTSEDLLSDLDANADDLGKALDKGITDYNALPNVKTKLPTFGSMAAAGVRGLGGIYIRARQAKYLRGFVAAAEPMVQTLTRDVTDLLQDFSAPEAAGKPSFSAEATRMDVTYNTYFSQRNGQLAPSEWLAFISVIQKAEAGEDLTRSVIKATAKIGKAHSALVKAVQEDTTLKGRLAELEILSDQIKAASALKKKLDTP